MLHQWKTQEFSFKKMKQKEVKKQNKKEIKYGKMVLCFFY